jgi:UDP-N-acetylmuramoylalanine--D-glutamate ligase
VLFFNQQGGFPGDGALIKDEQIVVRRGQKETPVCHVRDILLLGNHNRDNVLTACALASAAEVSPEAMASAITSFTGVTHRLEPVAEIEGVRYYNDSIATSPERTVAGLRSFTAPIILLAGGRDKHLPLEPMIAAIEERCKGVVLFGEMASMLEAALEDKGITHHKAGLLIKKAGGLDEAVNTAHNWASAGDVVLLSPGGTSFDMFTDFEERGEEFKRLVNDLAEKG